MFICAKCTFIYVNSWKYTANIRSLALPWTSWTRTNFNVICICINIQWHEPDEQLHLWMNNCTFAMNNCTFAMNNCTFAMNNCTFGQSNITTILSILRNGWLLTPIENQLHSMPINCVLETYNNAICIGTHNQLHLHTIVYSKWSIINVNWQTCV